MTFRITLLRHGLSQANKSDVVQGQLDFPLAEEGIAQARLLAEYWQTHGEHFDLIVSSPLLRARQTAEIIAAQLSLIIEFDPGLMERHMGEGQGLGGAEFDGIIGARPRPSVFEPMLETGESAWELYRRASDALGRLLQREPGSYLVVSHGALLNALLRAVLALAPSGRARQPSFEFANTAFVELSYDEDEGNWRMHRLNATPHLEETWRPS
jgi:broad specificity phosphatase PhoE